MLSRFSIKQFLLDLKLNDSFSLIVFSLIMYHLVSIVLLLQLGKGVLYYTFQLFPLLLFSIGLFSKKTRYYNTLFTIDNDSRLLMIIFFLWNVITFIRGVLDCDSFQDLSRMFLYPREGLFFLAPFLSLVVINNNRLNQMMLWWIVYMSIGCLCTYFYRDVIGAASFIEISILADDGLFSFFDYINLASLPANTFNCMAFIFIYNRWNSLSQKYFIYVVIIVSIISALLLGRRSTTFSIILFIFLFLLLNIRFNKKLLLLYFSIISVLFYLFIFYGSTLEDLFPILLGRLTDDTRSWAEAEFYQAFDGDYLSWIFGRGAKALFWSPVYGFRNCIETGYLDLILHGGVIYLVLYVIILLLAFYRGFWGSTNRLVNSMALYLLGNVILLYPFTPMKYFGPEHLSVWICVICCLSKNIRTNGLS